TAELGCGQSASGKVVDGLDVLAHNQAGALGGGAGDDVQGLALGLVPAVDGGVGAEEGGVDLTGEERVDGIGATVEDLGLQLDALAQRLVQGSDLHAYERRGVGEVREVAEGEGGAVGL